MMEMLDKMWIGAKYRMHNFIDNFMHEEKGAAEIVAIILVIVVVIAVVLVFRERIMALVTETFDNADKVKDAKDGAFLPTGKQNFLL